MGHKIGIYNLHMRAMGGGEKLTLVLADHLSRAHDVTLFCAEPVDVQALEQFFAVDLSRVTVVPLQNNDVVSKVISKVPRVRSRASVRYHYRQLKNFNLDIFINNSYGSNLPCPAPHGLFMCMFPHSNADSKAIDTYRTIVAVSAYSADWVQ